MSGYLLNNGTGFVTGANAPASSPPMTASPAAATTVTSASAIAFGGGATPVQGGGLKALFSAQFIVPVAAIVLMVATYHSLPA